MSQVLQTKPRETAAISGKTELINRRYSMASEKVKSQTNRKLAASLYKALKTREHHYEPQKIANLLAKLNQGRVNALATSLQQYISTNLPNAIEQREGLASYRTNPYVLLACANVMKLSEPKDFADFLFNTKLYMGLETSFGKSIEAVLVGQYPVTPFMGGVWSDPLEKLKEQASLTGLTQEEKALERNNSIWREIDKSCVIGNRRYLISIKSDPNCINDTQVAGMTTAIAKMHSEWMSQTRVSYPSVTELDVVVGITYGTDRTTNNKENQILAKLLGQGFVEEDRQSKPGILIDEATRSVRVYRLIGQDFWSFIGNPVDPASAPFVFLELLIALTKALADVMKAEQVKGEGRQISLLPDLDVENTLEARVNRKLERLAVALNLLKFPRNSLPVWVREDFSENDLFWLATAMTAFYDVGI